ncbi:MAG: hypothetical protein LBH98_03585 [Chitinispirillales bacterium]|jgi:hypothetical protein|nr:hypothetical protein [Chitinispirillales bacterium]
MKFNKSAVLCFAFLIICSISAKKNEKKESSSEMTTSIKTTSAPLNPDSTDECILMKEICDAAVDFQREYNAMPDGDEKKEMVQVLNGYILHCEKARKDCSKSLK